MTDMQCTVYITPLDEDNPAYLFRRDQGQSEPQPCHIDLDLRDGELTADYNPEVGGDRSMPALVVNGIRRWWGIPCLTAAAANRVMRELTPLAQRVLTGATVDDDNEGVTLTEDALDAEQQITDWLTSEDVATDDDLIGEMEAAEWWSEGELPDGLTPDTTDRELERIVDAEATDVVAVNPGWTVLTGAVEYLSAVREKMRTDIRDDAEIVATEHARYEVRRNELIGRMRLWGDSSRDVAAVVGLSHVAVQKIATRVNHVHGPGAAASNGAEWGDCDRCGRHGRFEIHTDEDGIVTQQAADSKGHRVCDPCAAEAVSVKWGSDHARSVKAHQMVDSAVETQTDG